MDKEALQGRIDHLVELDDTRRMARNQEKVKGTFDRKARQRDFKEGDQVLSWDKEEKSQECIKNSTVFG
jgi:hypothetical protein